MDSVPVSLPKFDVPGLNAEVDDSIRGRAVAATCLPPSDRQRKYSRRRMGTRCLIRLQLESFLRPETYDSCQPIADANDAFKTGGRSVRSINGEDVVCYRLFSLVQGNPSLPINQGSFEPLVQNGAVINTTATASYPALLGSTYGKSACYPSMVVYRSYELA